MVKAVLHSCTGTVSILAKSDWKRLRHADVCTKSLTPRPCCRFCEENPYANFAVCSVPQELSDEEIDRAVATVEVCTLLNFSVLRNSNT